MYKVIKARGNRRLTLTIGTKIFKGWVEDLEEMAGREVNINEIIFNEWINNLPFGAVQQIRDAFREGCECQYINGNIKC